MRVSFPSFFVTFTVAYLSACQTHARKHARGTHHSVLQSCQYQSPLSQWPVSETYTSANLLRNPPGGPCHYGLVRPSLPPPAPAPSAAAAAAASSLLPLVSVLDARFSSCPASRRPRGRSVVSPSPSASRMRGRRISRA